MVRGTDDDFQSDVRLPPPLTRLCQLCQVTLTEYQGICCDMCHGDYCYGCCKWQQNSVKREKETE
jgi:hypothetical protein